MEKSSYKYSSTQLNLPAEIANAIFSYGKEKIEDSQINEDAGGREDECHITLLYGITDDSSKNYIIDDVVKKKFNGTPIKIKLGPISKFYQDEHDVLKIDIDDYTGKLKAIFNTLKENVDNENKYPEYHPHCTIAYINKGECEELIGDETFSGKEVILKDFKYNPKDEGVEKPEKPEMVTLAKIAKIEKDYNEKAQLVGDTITLGEDVFSIKVSDHDTVFAIYRDNVELASNMVAILTLYRQIEDNNDDVDINNIQVSTPFRRKGIATCLYNYAKHYLLQKEKNLIHSDVLTNDGAVWKNTLSKIAEIEKEAAANIIEPRAFDPKFLREVFPQIKNVSATEDEKFLRKYLEEFYFMQPATADVVLHQYNKMLNDGTLDSFIMSDKPVEKGWERSKTNPNILVKPETNGVPPIVPIVPISEVKKETEEPKKEETKPQQTPEKDEIEYDTLKVKAKDLDTGSIVLETDGVLSALVRKRKGKLIFQELVSGKTHPIPFDENTEFNVLTLDAEKQIIIDFANEGLFDRLPDAIKSDWGYLKNRVAAIKSMLNKKSVFYISYEQLKKIKDVLKDVLQGKIIANVGELDNIYDYPNLISWLSVHGRKDEKIYKLSLENASQIKAAVRALKDLVYHIYSYKIDGNSLLFRNQDDMLDVKKLLKNKKFIVMDSVIDKFPSIKNIDLIAIKKKAVSYVEGEARVKNFIDVSNVASTNKGKLILNSDMNDMDKFTALKSLVNENLHLLDDNDAQIDTVEFDYANPIIDDQDIWKEIELTKESMHKQNTNSFSQPREFKQGDLVLLVNNDKALEYWGDSPKSENKSIDRITIRPLPEYLNQGAKIKNQLAKEGFNVTWEEADISIIPSSQEDIEKIVAKIKELPVEVIYPFDITQGKPLLNFMQMYYVLDTKMNSKGEQEILIDDDNGEENWFLSSGFIPKPEKIFSKLKHKNAMALEKGSKIVIFKDPKTKKNTEGIGVLSHFVAKNDKDKLEYWKVQIGRKNLIKAIDSENPDHYTGDNSSGDWDVKPKYESCAICDKHIPQGSGPVCDDCTESEDPKVQNEVAQFYKWLVQGINKKAVAPFIKEYEEGYNKNIEYTATDALNEAHQKFGPTGDPDLILDAAVELYADKMSMDVSKATQIISDELEKNWHDTMKDAPTEEELWLDPMGGQHQGSPNYKKYEGLITALRNRKIQAYDPMTRKYSDLKIDQALISSVPLESSNFSLEGVGEGEEDTKPALAKKSVKIDPNQSVTTMAKQLAAMVQEEFANSLTYPSIFECAKSSGIYPALDNATLVNVLNLVAISFDLQRTSWDHYLSSQVDEEIFQNLVSDPEKHQTGLGAEENRVAFDDFVKEHFDNDAPDKIFIVDRLIEENIKHFLNLPQLLEESANVIYSSIKRIKKDSIVTRYKLEDIKIGKTNLGGKIVNGELIFNITLKSKARFGRASAMKTITVTLPVEQQRVKNPKFFTFAKKERPLQTYYLNSIFESSVDIL